MLPLMFGGIANMIFTKTKVYNKYKYPIDCYKTLNNKRIFGDNKTYIGFVSMIFFCIIFQVLIGFLCNSFSINKYNDLYLVHKNTLGLNLLFGFLIGFVYMIFELPNSFIKRKLNIDPGKTTKGLKGIIFFIVDQIDSLIGVMFILFLFSNFSILKYFGYVILGAISHIILNLILFLMKVRKNI